jgi:Trypsin-like peptidase domain
MNIANMCDYFRIVSLAKAVLPAARVGLATILTYLVGTVLIAPVIALVGPAREAPEFAPYVVAVLDKSGGGGAGGANFCTASVLAPDIVLTAAHCVSDPSDTRVFYRGGQDRRITWTLALVALLVLLALCFGRVRKRAGVKIAFVGLILFGGALASYSWTKFVTRLVFFDTASIAVHPEFRPRIVRKHVISIDLALLRLAEPLPPAFKPIELADSGPVATGQPFRMAGFGRGDESVSGTSGVLRAGILVASGPKSPVLVWLTDPDGTGLGGCTGDSGAPILAIAQPALVAVAIRAKGYDGYSCGATTEAVLIGPQMPWIRKTLQAWGATGSMAP